MPHPETDPQPQPEVLSPGPGADESESADPGVQPSGFLALPEALELPAEAGAPQLRAAAGPATASLTHGTARRLPQHPAFSLGQVVAGRYRIVRFIAQGGMGEVYEARDLELGEAVALKTVRSEDASDELMLKRFRREIQLARKVTHPNVCRLFEFGQHQLERGKSVLFLTMELLQGQTLAERLEHGEPLSEELALPLVRQMAEALESAHEAGVVHRDFKSANVMLVPSRRGERAVVTDFGLARSSSAVEGHGAQSLTVGGAFVGTPAYVAPEQVEGAEATASADVYALGVVMYEMLTGRWPFEGETPLRTALKRLTEAPAPPRSYAPQISPRWEAVILRCLERDPAKRFTSASAVIEALESGLPALHTQALEPRTRRRRALLVLAAAIAVLFAAGLATSFLGTGGRPIDSIAVLPFLSADPETEYLGDGMAESLILSLSQLPRLRVMARSTAFTYKGREVDPRKVGIELGVQAVLLGRVTHRGEELSVAVELVDAADGSQLWGEHYSRKPSQLLPLQQELSREILTKLRLRLTGEEQRRLAKRYTDNVEAYRAYLQGRHFAEVGTEEDLKTAAAYFQQAIDKDPDYALAYAGLSFYYASMADNVFPPRKVLPKARAAARRALELDETLAETHVELAYINYNFDRDFVAAEREFQRAFELNPNLARAYHQYGWFLAMQGLLEKSKAAFQRAQQLDPLSFLCNLDANLPYELSRQYDQAVEQCRKARDIDPHSPLAHMVLGWIADERGDYAEAIAELKQARSSYGDKWPFLIAWLGHAYAASGRTEEARKVLDDLHELSKRRYVSPFCMAVVHAGLGEQEHTLQWLEKSYDDGSGLLIWLNVEPIFDFVRPDPRFQDLSRRVGFRL